MVAPEIRQDIEALMRRERTHVRADLTPGEIQLYARSIIVMITGTWHYSALSRDVHLYRDVSWDQDAVDEYREVLEEFFGVPLPSIPFYFARSVADVCDQVMRALRRECRMLVAVPPAA